MRIIGPRMGDGRGLVMAGMMGWIHVTEAEQRKSFPPRLVGCFCAFDRGLVFFQTKVLDIFGHIEVFDFDLRHTLLDFE